MYFWVSTKSKLTFCNLKKDRALGNQYSELSDKTGFDMTKINDKISNDASNAVIKNEFKKSKLQFKHWKQKII